MYGVVRLICADAELCIPDEAPSGSSLLSLSSKKNLVYWHFLKTVAYYIAKRSPNGKKLSSWPLWLLISSWQVEGEHTVTVTDSNLKDLDSVPGAIHSVIKYLDLDGPDIFIICPNCRTRCQTPNFELPKAFKVVYPKLASTNHAIHVPIYNMHYSRVL